ncbi:hypothetical protein OPQ81_007587 [Rhizoctonia solani]|nr:hypothetical protein OPQ81_007587 [Rhizoctonia solani]
MFVKRSDGRLRLVVDYKKLNKITIKNRYALPRQEELIDKLKHAKIFTKLDLRNSYNNIRIKEGHEWKTAFRTKYGHYEYTVMPFGLTNAPAVFQRFMNDIFQSKEGHVKHVEEVLAHLQDNNLFCNPDKCHFFVQEVTYIGLVVSPEGICMEKDKVQSIMGWPTPRNAKDIEVFQGFANFYRRFVSNFPSIIRPLTLLTHKEQPVVWEKEPAVAFQAIKEAISKEPVLIHPDESKPYFLETDASGAAMGAVLSQKGGDGCLHPVAFMSKTFEPAEMNYDTHDKELLAIICAFEHWRIPGKLSQKPDALSRRPDHLAREPTPQILLPESIFQATSAEISASFTEKLHDALQEDPSLDAIMTALSDASSLPHSTAQKFKDYTLQEGLLFYQGRMVVPDEPELKQELLAHFHDSSAAGYQERACILELIRHHYYWPVMKFQVNRYLDSCEICQRSKGHEKHYALKPLSVPSGPWEDISYDFIVKLPKCQGHDSVLVIVHRFSKMVHFISCKETAAAEDVAQLFLQHIWKLHGTPKQTVSDRGSTFNSKFLRALYKALQIEPSFSTAYHPQSDGQTEIKNQWLKEYLCPYINHRQSDWVEWLPLAEFAHHNSRSGATGKSPFEIIYGYSPIISLALEPTGSPAADDRSRELPGTIQEVQDHSYGLRKNTNRQTMEKQPRIPDW